MNIVPRQRIPRPPLAAGLHLTQWTCPPSKQHPWSHFYSEGVSAGHIGLASRADYRAHMAMAARECGFKYVRGHGLLDDDVGVSFAPGLNSWLNIFSMVDFQLGAYITTCAVAPIYLPCLRVQCHVWRDSDCEHVGAKPGTNPTPLPPACPCVSLVIPDFAL